MGWAMLLLLGMSALAAMVLLRLDRRLWTMAAAAVMLGAAGYAWQGRPSLPAASAAPRNGMLASDEAIIDLRGQMFGRFGSDGAYLTAADALARTGSVRYEVQALLGGIRRDPRSVQLWTALGDALARHDRQFSPPARLALDQAARLNPRHPAPLFFRGLAQVRTSDLAGAEASWQRALALTAADASYRSAIAERLAMLRRLRAATGG